MTAHHYKLAVEWTGNRGTGTSGYRDYDRSHVISAAGKPAIPGSSDPAFRGDAARWNPEELLLASASACHKLWYLHLCADAGIIVTAYVDEAEGTMNGDRFERVVLRPRVTISAGDRELALRLHHKAHEECYIAKSVNFPIDCEPSIG
ncbi:OsmC family peroxiredoxin [Duganella sp. FT135W]|uniref:OsmC family peroxiredoxin n=1 Tax=Duganella flavida TaxID=2692175 RepID=A0A6L8KFW0_9BURK|nr:OsmC family protein [Duganella flavida]MYM26333.1 OsmC family peroxiredoxin [Duganella flavida]